ncbi:rod shape-determining protein MreD [Carnimonas nigrificans]|uniref:rod shape-determining protein MreD n=1 Tax=Carnimonas nigrificans TaxID=64323 RepID=UPI0004BBDA09|nr:rod shape-determining protein MreD [Carnimonas nigrificans]
MAAEKNRAVYPMVWLTLIAALVLQLMPMPDSLLLLRPPWIAMTLIFWCLAQPLRVGVFHGFIIGLPLDLLNGTPLGQNALLLSGVCFLTLLLYSRIRLYSLWQQAPVVVVITGLVLLCEQWLRVLFGVSELHIQFIYGALISGLLWPWFSTLLYNIQRGL